MKFNAIPLFGTIMSDALKLKMLLNNPPRVNVLLDDDAMKHSLKICKFLLSYNIPTYLVNVGDKDASEHGHKVIHKLINITPRLTESDLYKLNIANNI